MKFLFPINSEAETSEMVYAPPPPTPSILILLSVVSPPRVPVHFQRPSARRAVPEGNAQAGRQAARGRWKGSEMLPSVMLAEQEQVFKEQRLGMVKGRIVLIPKAGAQRVRIALKLRAKGKSTQGLRFVRFFY